MSIDFQDCLVPWHKHGIQFSYPGIWEITEEQDGTDVIITVTCNEGCFWTLRILPGCPAPPHVVESCVEAFQDEYEDVEVQQVDTQLAEMPAYARDLDFFFMELTNSVGLRSVRTSEATLLVWWQGTHHELLEMQPILDHMTRSVRADCLMDG